MVQGFLVSRSCLHRFPLAVHAVHSPPPCLCRPLTVPPTITEIPSICRRLCLLIQVDAVAEKDLGQRFGITGFPSLKFFPAGDEAEVEAYDGARSLESMVEFLNKKARTALGLQFLSLLPFHAPSTVVFFAVCTC